MTDTPENLQKYEELFGDRFSAEDREYQQYVSRPADPPPIVEDWRSRGGGNHRGRDNRSHDRRGGHGWGGGGRGWGGDRSWRGDHRGQQHWQDRDRERERDRDRDRHCGHGSGSNQMYNSHHQRPHHGRY